MTAPIHHRGGYGAGSMGNVSPSLWLKNGRLSPAGDA